MGECVRVRGCGCTGAGVCLCACSLTNAACNAPQYCNLRPLWLHQTFRQYLIKGIIFGKKLLNIQGKLLFPLQFLFQTFFIPRRTGRDNVINVKTSSCKVPVIKSVRKIAKSDY